MSNNITIILLFSIVIFIGSLGAFYFVNSSQGNSKEKISAQPYSDTLWLNPDHQLPEGIYYSKLVDAGINRVDIADNRSIEIDLLLRLEQFPLTYVLPTLYEQEKTLAIGSISDHDSQSQSELNSFELFDAISESNRIFFVEMQSIFSDQKFIYSIDIFNAATGESN